MKKRESWDDIKAGRGDSLQHRRGYDKAGRAIRLASELRRLREAQGLSQRELAEQVGTTQSAIARLEAGNNPPNLLLLDRIADALGAELTVSLTDLDQRTSAG